MLFDSSEFAYAYSIASLPVLFQWDAYVIPTHGQRFLYMTHNESFVVLAKDDKTWQPLRERFDVWNRIGDATRYVNSVSLILGVE